MSSTFNPHEMVWTEESIKNFWNNYSTMSSYSGNYYSKQVGRELINLVKKYIKIENKVLDFGCGTGNLMKYLMDEKINCFGVDSSKESIDTVKEKFENNNYFDGAAFNDDIHDINLKFAIIFSLEMLEHIMQNQIESILEDCRNLLIDKGKIVITVPNNENLNKYKFLCPECGAIFHRMQHINKFTAVSLDEMMSKHGFSKILCLETNLFFYKEGFYSKFKLFYNSLKEKLGKDIYKPHLVYIGEKK